MKAVETQRQSSEHREIPEALLENQCKETAKSWTSGLREVFTVRSSTKIAFVLRSVKLKIQTFVTMTTDIMTQRNNPPMHSYYNFKLSK